MATDEQVAEVRRLTSEVGSDTYTDQQIKDKIDEAGNNLDVVAADIWREKSRDYLELTDISEAGSSRKNSVLYERAVEQAEHFEARAAGESASAATSSGTRRIVRL